MLSFPLMYLKFIFSCGWYFTVLMLVLFLTSFALPCPIYLPSTNFNRQAKPLKNVPGLFSRERDRP